MHVCTIGFTLLTENRAKGVSSDTRELIAINYDPYTGQINARREDMESIPSRRISGNTNNGRGESNMPDSGGSVAGISNQEGGGGFVDLEG